MVAAVASSLCVSRGEVWGVEVMMMVMVVLLVVAALTNGGGGGEMFRLRCI